MTQDRRITDKLPGQELEWNTDRKLIDAALHHLDTERAASCLLHVPDTDPQLYVAAGTKDALRGLMRDDPICDTEVLAGQVWQAPTAASAQQDQAVDALTDERIKEIALHVSKNWASLREVSGLSTIAFARAIEAEVQRRGRAQGGNTSKASAESDQQEARDAAAIEAEAQRIYSLFVGADKHPWVNGGNSEKQDQARRLARAGKAYRESLNEVPAPTCNEEKGPSHD